MDEMISYTKGCYVGQEIIARIHFRGHVAKQLMGLVFNDELTEQAETRPLGSVPVVETELSTVDGKNAGKITSVTFSPKPEKTIALAFVRYDFLAAGTELSAGELKCVVTEFPIVAF